MSFWHIPTFVFHFFSPRWGKNCAIFLNAGDDSISGFLHNLSNSSKYLVGSNDGRSWCQFSHFWDKWQSSKRVSSVGNSSRCTSEPLSLAPATDQWAISCGSRRCAWSKLTRRRSMRINNKETAGIHHLNRLWSSNAAHDTSSSGTAKDAYAQLQEETYFAKSGPQLLMRRRYICASTAAQLTSRYPFFFVFT